MATTLSVTTTLGISATLPATIDAAGYGAVVFTAIGEVIDISEIGVSYNVVEHQSVTTRYPTKKKGVYNFDDVTVTMAMDDADAGQILIAAALASDNSYSIEIATPDAVSRFVTGKVTSFKKGAFAGDDTIVASLTLAIDPETLVEV